MATNLSQYGITWIFNGDYTTGQFVNGDYWVIGPLTINSVSPAPYTARTFFFNGSMVNPPNGSQSYDSRTTYYGHPYEPSLSVSYPVVIPNGSSLVSTISRNQSLDFARPALQTAAVLTVLATPPASGSFRRSRATPS